MRVDAEGVGTARWVWVETDRFDLRLGSEPEKGPGRVADAWWHVPEREVDAGVVRGDQHQGSHLGTDRWLEQFGVVGEGGRDDRTGHGGPPGARVSGFRRSRGRDRKSVV